MTQKCSKCGGYVHDKPFYILRRPPLGNLYVWVCPKCGNKIEQWKIE